MSKNELMLTITCYSVEQFNDCEDQIKQFHTYNKITYHQFQTILLIEITDDNLDYLCGIWGAVEDTGADLAIRNFAR